jgi:hypothetical protein
MTKEQAIETCAKAPHEEAEPPRGHLADEWTAERFCHRLGYLP